MDVAVELFLLRVRKKYSKALLPLDNFDGAGAVLKDVATAALAPLVAGNYKGSVGKSLSCEMTTIEGVTREALFYTLEISLSGGGMVYASEASRANGAVLFFCRLDWISADGKCAGSPRGRGV